MVGVSFRPFQRKRRRESSVSLFLEHQFAINDVHLAAKFRPHPEGVSFRRWLAFSEPLSKSVSLIPDGYFETNSQVGIRGAFLEVDLGTESLRVWKRKAELYLQLAIGGEFTRLFELNQFRVLVVAPSHRRMNTIRSVVGRSTDKIFWFSTFESINRDGFWSPIWFRPRGDQELSLI